MDRTLRRALSRIDSLEDEVEHWRGKYNDARVSAREGYREDWGAAIRAVIHAAAASPEGIGLLHDLLFWLSHVARHEPTELRILDYSLETWRGCLPDAATRELAREIGVSERTVNKYLHAINNDPYLRHLMVWRRRRRGFRKEPYSGGDIDE